MVGRGEGKQEDGGEVTVSRTVAKGRNAHYRRCHEIAGPHGVAVGHDELRAPARI